MKNNDLTTQYAIYVLESLRDAGLTEDYYRGLNMPIPAQLEETIWALQQRASDAKKQIEEVAPGLWDSLAKDFSLNENEYAASAEMGGK